MFALFLLGPLAAAALCFLLAGRTKLHVALKTPLVLLGSFLAIATVVQVLLLAYLFATKTPGLDDLAQHFTERRPTLESLRTMAQADREYSRLNRAYVTLAATGKSQSTRSALIPDRWQRYRDLFAAAGLRDGWEQDAAGNLFLIAGGEGLLHRGHATGYVFCAAVTPRSPFAPCREPARSTGSQPYDVMTNKGGYQFRRIAAGWFVLDLDHS